MGLPLLLRISVGKLRDLFSTTDDLLRADLRLANISDVSACVVEALAELGVNSVIAHAFIGREELLTSYFRGLGRGIKPHVVGLDEPPGGLCSLLTKHLNEVGVWWLQSPGLR